MHAPLLHAPWEPTRSAAFRACEQEPRMPRLARITNSFRRTRRMLERVRADFLFGPLYRSCGRMDAAVRAGFFDDGLSRDALESLVSRDTLYSNDWQHVLRRRRLQKSERKPECVLVTTGAFSPCHTGHLTMLAQARRAMQARGYTVLGGVIAPDHDSYVQSKSPEYFLSIGFRDALLRAALGPDNDWLSVDLWASMVAPCPLNFSDIIAHVRRSMHRFVPDSQNITLIYVFGGDNAAFLPAFAASGGCVCVPRPLEASHKGASAPDTDVMPVAPSLCHPLCIVSDMHRSIAASSTVIRGGDKRALPTRARRLWQHTQTWQDQARLPIKSCTRHVTLRDEGAWAVAHWARRYPEARASIERAYARFVDELQSALQKAYAHSTSTIVPTRLHRSSLRMQQAAVQAALGNRDALSLDPCLPGTYTRQVSRGFVLGTEARQQGIVTRPGAEAMDLQLERLPNTNVVLIDDDVATGGTMRAVRRLLDTRLTIVDMLTAHDCLAAPQDDAASEAKAIEICDARDFLLGARHAGLVSVLPSGGVSRAPYLYPYVRNVARLSLPERAERGFSAEVWALNVRFFQSLSVVLTVDDVHRSSADFLREIGYKPDSNLACIAQRHASYLSEANVSHTRPSHDTSVYVGLGEQDRVADRPKAQGA